MESLIELCDLIADNPVQFEKKLVWICGRCPSAEALLVGSPSVSRYQLNAVLALTRFLSRCSNCEDERPKSLVIAFFRSIPSSFNLSFWPPSFRAEAIASFYNDFLGYLSKASDISLDFSTDVAAYTGVVLTSALAHLKGDLKISKAFMNAMARNFPPILPSDANKLISTLIEKFDIPVPTSPRDAASNGSSGVWKSNMDLLAANMGYNDDGAGAGAHRQAITAFEEEAVESLEKREMAFKLIGHIMDRVTIDAALLEQVRGIARDQLHSMVSFLKIRKSDWSDQGQYLKVRINTKLSVYQAASWLQIKTLSYLDSDAKSSKRLLHGALALLVEAAEACLLSMWRKLRACEELFSTLLFGISQAAAARSGQLLRVLLIRFKPLVLATCARGDTWSSSQGAMFESVLKTSCEIIELGWQKDRSPIETFIMGLATSIRERNDYGEEQEKEKQEVPAVQLNVIQLLADLNVSVNKPEVLLDAVSRMASLGFEKSYREAIVLMTRSYMSKLASIDSAESKDLPEEANTERVETLPAGFLQIASGLTNPKLRLDYRHRLLSLCSDVGLAAESKSGRSGAGLLGPLLPAVAEICSDFDPTSDIEPSLLKLFRNLWFYIALFGLAPPITKNQGTTKSAPTAQNNVGNTAATAPQEVGGTNANAQWSAAVKCISHGTPPLVVSSVKWLEDELELNALHNPSSRRGSGNEKAALSQRTALSAALGGRVDVSAMSTISGAPTAVFVSFHAGFWPMHPWPSLGYLLSVKATYLLAVAFLEIIRFISNGGILNVHPSSTASRSSFSCVFEYLKSPNLVPAVSQCLTAIVHRAFETALSWLEDQTSDSGRASETRETTLSIHACFLIKNLTQRDEHVRDISVNLLNQFRDRFPQILWNSSCLDSLLLSVQNDPSSALVNDPAWVATVRSLCQKTVREWIIVSLSYAPCTSQGLLQERLCVANTLQKAQPTTDVVSLLSEIKIGTGKNDNWSGTKTANIPAVIAAAAAASGANLKLTEAFNLEVLSTGIVSANVKCNHAGEIAGMRRLYETIGGVDPMSAFGNGQSLDLPGYGPGALTQNPQSKNGSFCEVLLTRFVRLLQKFVNTAEKGDEVDKSSFRETCSQATALLLSYLGSDAKSNIESFSQLLRLLCWCPAYILTPDAMETGIFIWTWLVSAAPQFGPIILAELVDAWLWTVDTRRGLFASEARYSGPAAKLRPHLQPGEPELLPGNGHVDQIMAHRLWIGFFIDRFEVVRQDSVEQLLLLGRLLQGSTKLPWNFTRHPCATGTFFTLMLLGLKFCSCKSQGSSQNFRTGLQLLEDRIYRSALGWFSHKPDWFDMSNNNFALSEAQSVSVFVHHLLNEPLDTQLDTKGQVPENGSSNDAKDQYHPVWGKIENYAAGKEKRKQLLLMLSQHEADRLEVWAHPVAKESALRPKISSEKMVDYAKTAFAVDPRIALALASRFPTNNALKGEVTQLVQSHILEIRNIPEALPYFVTPKAIDENSSLLQQLPHWAAASITMVLDFLTPPYKGHPRVMAYVLRVLESYPPDSVTFFMPQLVQALRYDDEGETCEPEAGVELSPEAAAKNAAFLELLPEVRQQIIDGFNDSAREVFTREFNFFDKVTSISGVLFPIPKEERRAGIRRELEKIEMDGDDLYLPTDPFKLVRGIQVDSGIPLQSAAKVPIMITFNVVDKDGDHNDIKPQACIFKVGDDCRQDVLALQVISLLKDIFAAVGLKLYLYPYGVLPTGPERGIIEVVPNSRSRSQMGETNDGGLYEIFQQDFGPVGSPGFETARMNFIISSAGYAVASLLLQPKDRHNGNLLFDSVGRLVHIDFGFILETSPGNNMRFESAHFKLSHEMTQLVDPSGVMKSETWYQFVSLCVKGYLAARSYTDGITNTVLMMLDSGLPCFSRGDPIGNLRKRFHPEMSEREAANFMIRTCQDAYNKWTTAGYDLIQYLQQGVEK
nr:phosphatidylinositol 4-kinase alpha 1 [Ipomoea batatas]